MQSTYNTSRNKIKIGYLIQFFGGTNMSRIIEFFRNVRKEMRKVTWPKRKELTSYTITVIATVAILAVFFAIVDTGISELIRLILG